MSFLFMKISFSSESFTLMFHRTFARLPLYSCLYMPSLYARKAIASFFLEQFSEVLSGTDQKAHQLSR